MKHNQAGISAAGECNVGLVRETNEDSFCLVALPERRTVFAAVADGIGGHHDGALASFICCRDLLTAYINSDDRDFSGQIGCEKFLRDSISRVNRKIFDRNYSEVTDHPMGSTLCGALFTPDFFTLFNLGDSRLYEWLPGAEKAIQLSHDHTLRDDPAACEQYHISLTDGKLANVICRAVGPRHDVEPQLASFERKPGARYLICSDGAYRYFTPDDIAAAFAGAATPRGAVGKLMRTTLLGGGRDNITVVALYSSAETAMEK